MSDTNTGKETRAFQTEVRQLLDLMIHSLYSNKEIFLRELISNASDAMDKLRFEGLANDALYEGSPDLEIQVGFDKEAKTVTIIDNGIGMNRDEVVDNIGTIARSGTKAFLDNLTGDQAKDSNLIGQFGVGFYSAFIVADKVSIVTRKAGDPSSAGVRWTSEGQGEYDLETVERAERGSEVTLYLRDGEEDFLDGWRLRSVIRKFSDHVPWPILMLKEEQDAPVEEEEKDDKAEDDKAEIVPEWETVNRASALWARPKNEIKEEEYQEFYKHVSHDFEESLAHVHARLEGKYEFTVLLYVPKRAPFDLWDRDRKHGVKLYVRRVFIMEGAEELMPRYLRFVRGVVDSADLPLNVSREILQQNKAVEALRKGAMNKVFSLLEKMAKKDAEKYAEFWKEFGQALKEGVIEDFENKARIAKLLRFSSTHAESTTPDVALADYVERMKPEQEKIYYALGETFESARNSPHLEIFRKKGIEVLILHERIDEWLANHLHDFDGKSLQAVSKGQLDLGKLGEEDEDEKKRQEEKAGTFKELAEKVKKALDNQVKEVRLTSRLTDSPSCLVGDDNDISPAMERILQSAGQAVPDSKRILELNPDHPLVSRLNTESNDAKLKDWSQLLFDQAFLSEGGHLDDPAGFVKRLNEMLLALAE